MSELLSIENALFLIIDVQEKLINAQFDKEKIKKNCTILTETAKILNIPVVVSEQYPKGLGSTIPEIKEKLPAAARFIEKVNFGCCQEEGFNDIIGGFGRKQIVVCGMESHVCVHQTVYDLLSHGFEVHLVQDAVSSRKEWECEQGIKRMLHHGAVPTCVEMVLFELLKCAKHPEFKAVQVLIK